MTGAEKTTRRARAAGSTHARREEAAAPLNAGSRLRAPHTAPRGARGGPSLERRNVFFMRRVIMSIPDEVLEAAR